MSLQSSNLYFWLIFFSLLLYHLKMITFRAHRFDGSRLSVCMMEFVRNCTIVEHRMQMEVTVKEISAKLKDYWLKFIFPQLPRPIKHRKKIFFSWILTIDCVPFLFSVSHFQRYHEISPGVSLLVQKIQSNNLFFFSYILLTAHTQKEKKIQCTRETRMCQS